MLVSHHFLLRFFCFSAAATSEIYTLSLHDALPICAWRRGGAADRQRRRGGRDVRQPRRARAALLPGQAGARDGPPGVRSEEHTSELQSHSDLVCRLLLEKKKTQRKRTHTQTNKEHS